MVSGSGLLNSAAVVSPAAATVGSISGCGGGSVINVVLVVTMRRGQSSSKRSVVGLAARADKSLFRWFL